ncbi:MAG: DMT family transporter [Candidatus Woesearchaeota archaeon]
MSYKKGLLLVFLTAVISGFSIFLNKFGVNGINPYFFTFSKNIAVALLLLSVILVMGELKAVKQLKRDQWLKLGLVGLIGGSIPFLLFFKGLSIISSANAAFIHKIMFFFVAVLALIFLKEKINKSFIVAAALLLVGNFFLLRFTWNNLGFGELLILLATLFWAGENVLSKHLLKDLTPKIVAFGRMFFGSIFILAFLMATGNMSAANLGLSHWLWIAVTSLLLFGYVITWYTGLKHIEVSTATCVLLLGSVITTVLSSIFLSQAVTISEILGMAAITSGVALTAILASKSSLLQRLSAHRHSRSP